MALGPVVAAAILAIGAAEGLDFKCSDPPLGVKYDIKYYNGEVNCGTLLLESDIGGGLMVPPTVTHDFGTIRPAHYTLMMIDPDADLSNNGSWPDVTTPGGHAPVRHWVVGNIDHDMLKTGDFSKATTVSRFVGPSPPWGSHRYGQFLFRQSTGIIDDFETFAADEAITQWNYAAFIEKHSLGSPILSNWHVTQHADPRPSVSSIIV